MRETALVKVLATTGLSPNRAAAFERCLDDAYFCGIGADRLAAHIVKFVNREILAFKDALQVEIAAQRTLSKAEVALFSSTGYGLYTASESTSGPSSQ